MAKSVVFLFLFLFSFSVPVEVEAQSIQMASQQAYTAELEPKTVHQFLARRCDQKDAKSCENLGLYFQELGKRQEANSAMLKACELGNEDACSLTN